MRKTFKKFLRRRIKYVLLFFCLALLVVPLFAGAAVEADATGEAPYDTDSGDSTAGKIVNRFFGGIGAILGSAIAWVVYVINYLIATIFGVFISIIAWFIAIVLQINTNIVNTPLVQNGFSITLAVANLGFVLAIIVIAIMTILRYETYALKQTLWKLVAAAILVNFSLVIAGAILNFADNLSLYFLDGFNQSCGEGVSGAINPYDCFASNVAGAFAPQRVLLGPNSSTSTISSYLDQQQGAAGGGQTFGMILQPFLNLFFPTLFLIITVIALAGLFIMLLIRYIYLGILMVLMPIAWLLWIFPATSSHWHKWWSKFIQWTMFAPIVIFFVYLSVLSLGQTNSPEDFLATLRVQPSTGSGMLAGISNFLGGAVGTTLGTML